MEEIVPSTTALFVSARAAFDEAYRAHVRWRGNHLIEPDANGAREVIQAVDRAVLHLSAVRKALAALIEEGTNG